jgi:hypothetical protein
MEKKVKKFEEFMSTGGKRERWTSVKRKEGRQRGRRNSFLAVDYTTKNIVMKKKRENSLIYFKNDWD